MLCETYKKLKSDWQAARGEWIHFRLTADTLPAGVTEATSQELIRRRKEKVDEMKSTMILHAKKCKVCQLEQQWADHNGESAEKIA